MIPSSFINNEIELSKNNKSTSPFIRNFVFMTIDKSLRRHYGDNYSTLCLQSSAAVNYLLSRFNIFSQLIIGSVCVIEVFKDKGKTAWQWGGFWDQDHHIFTVTENSDLVDLTISQLHLHPHSDNKDFIPILPVWWSPINKWPPLIKYLPEKRAEISLKQNEMDDLEAFLKITSDTADEIIADKNAEDIVFSPFLTGIASLNQFTIEGNEWLAKAKNIVLKGIAYPDEIIEKENALLHSMK